MGWTSTDLLGRSQSLYWIELIMINISKKFLIENYIQKDLSLTDIEKRFGFKKTTVYGRLVKYDIPRRGFGGHKNQIDGTKKALTGKPSWNKGKGKRYIFDRGYKYILMPEHPMARKNGYIAEHRLVMSKYLKRELYQNELIHHINGIKDDNRIENLSLLKKTTHHGKTQCPYCYNEFFIK